MYEVAAEYGFGLLVGCEEIDLGHERARFEGLDRRGNLVEARKGHKAINSCLHCSYVGMSRVRYRIEDYFVVKKSRICPISDARWRAEVMVSNGKPITTVR